MTVKGQVRVETGGWSDGEDVYWRMQDRNCRVWTGALERRFSRSGEEEVAAGCGAVVGKIWQRPQQKISPTDGSQTDT